MGFFELFSSFGAFGVIFLIIFFLSIALTIYRWIGGHTGRRICPTCGLEVHAYKRNCPSCGRNFR